MDERKIRFNKNEYIIKETKKILKDSINLTSCIDEVHIFAQSLDIPDDRRIRLIVLPYSEAYLKGIKFATAEIAAKEILQNHGEQLRKYQNRLIFLGADGTCVNRFGEYIVSMLAWKSILKDYESNHIILDNTQTEYVREKIKSSEKTAKSSVRECYKHLLIPTASCNDGIPSVTPEWEEVPINSQASDMGKEIQKHLIENEYIILNWAPTHLVQELTRLFWKTSVIVTADTFWDASCRYLYLPRLHTDSVLYGVISQGQGVKDWFGIAYAHDDATDTYKDFRFGPTDRSFIRDKDLLLIQLSEAERYLQKIQQENPLPTPVSSEKEVSLPGSSDRKTPPTFATHHGGVIRPEQSATKFFGSVVLNSTSALNDFVNIDNEVLQHFSQRSDIELTIHVEISAKTEKGFDANIQRTIRENYKQLKFNENNTEFA